MRRRRKAAEHPYGPAPCGRRRRARGNPRRLAYRAPVFRGAGGQGVRDFVPGTLLCPFVEGIRSVPDLTPERRLCTGPDRSANVRSGHRHRARLPVRLHIRHDRSLPRFPVSCAPFPTAASAGAEPTPVRRRFGRNAVPGPLPLESRRRPALRTAGRKPSQLHAISWKVDRYPEPGTPVPPAGVRATTTPAACPSGTARGTARPAARRTARRTACCTASRIACRTARVRTRRQTGANRARTTVAGAQRPA